MTTQAKAIDLEDQYIELRSSQIDEPVIIDNVKIEQKCPYQRKRHFYQINYCITILVGLFIVFSILFVYKYIHRSEKTIQISNIQEKLNHFQSLNQNFAGVIEDENKIKKLQNTQSDYVKKQKNQALQQMISYTRMQNLQNSQYKKEPTQQQELKKVVNQKQLQQQFKQIMREVQILKENEQRNEEDGQNEGKIGDQELKELKEIEEQQLQVQKLLNDQMGSKEIKLNQNSQKLIKQKKINSRQPHLKLKPNQQRLPPPSHKSIQKSISPFTNHPNPSEQNPSNIDPILKVKNQMERRFKSKFQDLIFIKQGTKITEEQYYKAKDRMNLWKYFNPKTKLLSYLEQVIYQDVPLVNTQNHQLNLEKINKTLIEQQLQYEKKYQVSQYQEIPFCIIIPSYKNADKYFRNLNSILQQNYNNYHIIYIDDASKDGTDLKIKDYIRKYQIPEDKLLFIQNQVNKKALSNIDYAARKLCKSGQIMVIIDGDDYLIGTQVFKLINARYQSQKLLALYTNHLRVHEPLYLKVGTCIDYPARIKKMRSYRYFSIFPASHLRTFYVDLYWRINLRDLRDHTGQFFTAANDFAIMMPILEMASDRFQYLPQLTYVYDAGTGYNNFQTKSQIQAKNYKTTKRRHKYQKITHELQFEKDFKQKSSKLKQFQQKVAQQNAKQQNAKQKIQLQKKVQVQNKSRKETMVVSNAL